jgi:membrane fusion protein, multidrug efflux system
MAISSIFGSRRRGGIVAALVVLGAVAFGVENLSSRPPKANSGAGDPAVPVTAAVATREDVPDIVDAIGTVQSIDMVAIQPRVTGAIQKIEFTPGQDVKQGQELFLIDPRPYQAALDQATAQLAHDEGVLEEAQTDLGRYQLLEKEKSIASQQAQDQLYVVQQDKGTVQLDQANIETAKLNLEYCHITAPISGRAGTLLVDLGNLVGPPSGGSSTSTTTTSGQTASSSTLVSITQLQPIYVNFSIPQTVLHDVIRSQAKGALKASAYSQADKLLETGQLTVIDNQVNTSTGTAAMQATFTNKDEALWPGEYVSVQLVLGIRRNVVTVPASAVMVGPSGDYVYVIGSDNKVKRAAVTQAARRAGISVISKGISAGQKVVATGQYRLDNGTEVAVQQTTAPEPATQTAADPQPADADPPQ